MGWNANLLDAHFRGVPFHIIALSDKGGKSLVVHEYPYRSGGEVEDMGCRARGIPIRAVFWGSGYVYALQRLVQALEQPGAGELIHPVFGSVIVTIKSWEIIHTAQRPDYAEVSFEAIVSALDQTFFTYTSQKSQAEQAAHTANNAARVMLDVSQQSCIKTIRAIPASPLLQTQTSEQLSMLLDVYDPNGTVPRAMLSSVYYPEIFVSELVAVQQAVVESTPTTSIMEGFSYWSDRFPKVEPVCGMKNFVYTTRYPTGVGSWSVRWTSNGGPGKHPKTPSLPLLETTPQELVAVDCEERPSTIQATLEAHIVTHALLSQTYVCILTASQYLREESSRQTPILTPLDIETIVGNIRSRIQDCLTAVRETHVPETIHQLSEPLRTSADAIQTLGVSVVNSRPPLIRYLVEYAESLPLLAHRLYGEYTRSRELLRLNPQIYDPNFIPVGQELLIYAGGKKDV